MLNAFVRGIPTESGVGTLAWTKNPKFGVGGSHNMANSVNDHKLTVYPKKILILVNSAGAARFCITMGNHEFYNGAKAEFF